jgi:GNAT superfamily N-acetyltransferase
MESNTIIRIKDEDYTFKKDFRDIAKDREGFNLLTKATYGFDFEEWYQQGFWGDRYRPYSLFHNSNIVANISVNAMEFQVQGETRRCIQLGTVMTDMAYRGKGLSKALMNIVLEEYEKEYELIYLYANDTVLDFYPRFGFQREEEFVHVGYADADGSRYQFRKPDLREAKDKELLLQIIRQAKPCCEYAMLDNPGLIMFYLNSFLSENIYYCEELSLVAVAEYEENTLRLMDVFCKKEYNLKEVVNSLVTVPGMKIVLGFTPLDTTGFEAIPLRDEGTTFFTKGKNILKQGRFPELSHA